MDKVKHYVGKNLADPSSRQVIALVSLLVFLLGVGVTAVLSREITTQSESEYISDLEARVGNLGAQIDVKDKNYNRLLVASASRYAHDDTPVTAQNWGWFVTDMNLSANYPSLLGLGFAEYVTTAEVPQYVARMRSEGFDSIRYRADTDKYDDHALITYLLPRNDVNEAAVGYDMMSELHRRIAIQTARDTGDVATTEPVKLVQDADQGVDDVYGILKYYPIYHANTPLTTAEERKAAIYGFSYLVARPQDLFADMMRNDPSIGRDVNITVKDTTNNQTYTLYTLDHEDKSNAKQQMVTKDFSFGSRVWNVTVTGRDTSVNRFYGTGAVFALGTLISALAAATLFWLMRSRIVHVERKYEAEVQKSKDELLALASHQLRTPASGVKQYIGLLSGGMLGELNELQQEVARKAYDANERQLEIINELLYVSKIDAGQLQVKPRMANFTKLVRRSIDNFADQASRKNITLSFAKSTPDYELRIDDRYIGMVVENLISNAIKYSHPNTKVLMKLTPVDDTLQFSVADHGVGVPADKIPEMFGKFSRVENELSRSEGGSGLGLFLAMQLARAHGGDIQVTSREGKGSTFTLVLPMHFDESSQMVDLTDKSE